MRQIWISAALIVAFTLGADAAGIDRTAIDKSVAPGDDFYAYANGGIGFLVFSGITWGGGSPLKQVVTDNIIEDIGLTPVVQNINSTDWVTAGSTDDDNQYYVPNVTSNPWENSGSRVSFASWQGLGWDVHGSNGINPSWPNPSSCVFGAWPFN